MSNTLIAASIIILICVGAGYWLIFKPVRQGMKQLQMSIAEIQTLHKATENILLQSQQETANLSRALRTTHTSGNWGELQLQRVVELAGMLQYCDFDVQVNLSVMNRLQRPDLIIHLHNDRTIVVDAKAPIDAYIEAMRAEDGKTKKDKLANYVKRIRNHINELAQKEYWQNFQPSPAFVVLFLPSEAMFRVALENDPTIIDSATRLNVLLASPITLIGLLKAAAFGWSQENRARSIQEIINQSQSLHRQLETFSSQLQSLQKSLGKAVGEYNQLITFYSNELLPIIKSMRELDGTLVDNDKILQVNNLQVTLREPPTDIVELTLQSDFLKPKGDPNHDYLHS